MVSAAHAPGRSTRRSRRSRHRAGTAWLVADRLRGEYACYWYAGRNDDHLVERGRTATAADAVDWGRSRTANVRIRTTGGRTLWAGDGPRPYGFSHGWTDEAAAAASAGHATTGASPC